MSAHGHRLIGALLGALCVFGGARAGLGQVPLLVDEPATGNFSEDDWGLEDLTLDRDGDASWSDGYIFAGEAGQAVRVTASCEVPVFLVMLDPNGDTIEDAGGSGTFANLEEELPEAGVYTIIVNSPQSLPGNYTLTLSLTTAEPALVAGADAPPAEVPPAEAPPAEVPVATGEVEVAGGDEPPAEVPPAEAPEATGEVEVAGGDEPPAEVPPAEVPEATGEAAPPEEPMLASADPMQAEDTYEPGEEAGPIVDAGASPEVDSDLQAAVAVETAAPTEAAFVDTRPEETAGEPEASADVSVGEAPTEEPASATPGPADMGDTAVQEVEAPVDGAAEPTEATPVEEEITTPAAGHASTLRVGRAHRDAFGIGDQTLAALLPEQADNTHWSDAYAIEATGGQTLVIELRAEVGVYLALINASGRILAEQGANGLSLAASVSYEVPRDQTVYAVASTVDGFPGTYRITASLQP